MYAKVIEQLIKTLTNLDGILVKATGYAEMRGFPVDHFMTARLAPDMLPFWRQVTIACDVAKGIGAGLIGQDPPKFEDHEQTFAELRQRIAKTVAYLQGLPRARLDAVTAEQSVRIAYPPGKAMHAQDAIWSRAVPNFFFHVTTAYGLLRSGGVPIGKSDYLGELHVFDA